MNLKGYIGLLVLTLYGSLMQAQQILDTICANANTSSHLAVPYNSSLSYQWIINGGQVIGRSDTSDILIQWGSIPGLYLSSVVVEDFNGCVSDTSSVYMYLRGVNRASAKGPTLVCKGSMVTLETPLTSGFEWSGGKKQSSISFVATEDTTVMLVALNGICGNDTTYLTVSTVDIPEASISRIEDTLQLNEIRKLYYTGDPADFIEWYVNGQSLSKSISVLVNFDQVGKYEIVQVLRNGANCYDTLKKTVYVVSEFTIFIPNTFTPNGDGINELFTFDGVGIKSFRAQIYNRWGEMVYQWDEKSPVHGWDGTNNGMPSKIDAYVYKIVVEDQLGKQYYFHDSFNLIR